jgi:serine protease Do
MKAISATANFDMPEMGRACQDGRGSTVFNRRPRLGLEIQDVEEGKGVKILDVDSETPAAKAGLKKDDVISDIDGKTIASVEDLKEKP